MQTKNNKGSDVIAYREKAASLFNTKIDIQNDVISLTDKDNQFSALEAMQSLGLNFSLPMSKSITWKEMYLNKIYELCSQAPQSSNCKIFSSAINLLGSEVLGAFYSGGVYYGDQFVPTPKDYRKVLDLSNKINTGISQNFFDKATEEQIHFYKGSIYWNGGYGVLQNYSKSLNEYLIVLALMNSNNKNLLTLDASQIENLYVNLANAYTFGWGTQRDIGQAAIFTQKPAEMGNATAQRIIGTDYYYGNGVPQNYLKAYLWLDSALANGLSDQFQSQTATQLRDSSKVLYLMANKNVSPEQLDQQAQQYYQEYVLPFKVSA